MWLSAGVIRFGESDPAHSRADVSNRDDLMIFISATNLLVDALVELDSEKRVSGVASTSSISRG